MTANLTELDAHEQPSDEMRTEWKYFSKLEPAVLVKDPRIDDPRLSLSENGFKIAGSIAKDEVERAFRSLGDEYASYAESDVPIIYHPLLPGPFHSFLLQLIEMPQLTYDLAGLGLHVVPSLVPPAVQKTLLSKMLHRDLSNRKHQTNMHLHYDLPYPEPSSSSSSPSFFTLSPDTPALFQPKDPSVHKPLTLRQVLQRRLHWVTLGGQYDWTNRVYPSEEPLRFPADLSNFLESLFPETQAQAAIVNFYSPGDTMMMHRDVSEETDKGLISLSFGCDCLFMIAPSDANGPNGSFAEYKDGKRDGKPYLLLRLRSGDAIYMTQESRYAWHGVPKVLKGTCPDYLKDWPAEDGQYAEWEGWMSNKRINLNVRQMRD